MTLFFVNETLAKILDDPKSRTSRQVDEQTWKLAQIADVVVNVDGDRWLATKRRDAPGGYLHPEERAKLLQEYMVIVRMTDA